MRQLAQKVISVASSLALASTMFVVLPAGAFAADGASVDLTIGTRAELAAFRDAVNAGNTYAGKTVALSDDLVLSGSWEPIGTKSHPFCGTFDGNGHEVSGMQVTGTENLGFFGWVGAGGTVEDLTIGDDDGAHPSSVTAASETSVVRNVGSIAGYIYGSVEDEAISGCSSEASVSASSTMTQDTEKIGQYSPEGEPLDGSEGSIADGWTNGGVTIENIGGLAGYCAGSIADSKFTGTLDVATHIDPDEDYTCLAANVGGVAGLMGGYTYSEAVEGESKSISRAAYPQENGSYAIGTSEIVAHATSCKNSGTISTAVDGDGGLDRFGSQVSASLSRVGGVFGHAICDASGLSNAGLVDTETASGCGGVIGVLRGVPYTGFTDVVYDSGTDLEATTEDNETVYVAKAQGPVLTVSNCVNSNSVTGRAQVGGIIGQIGTRTQVTLCKNLKENASGKGNTVTGTRWNKPTVGGVVGQAFGSVHHSYNRADCKTETGGGYYVAGVVGMVSMYSTNSDDGYTSATPEVSNCFNTGSILAGGDYKQAGIIGENAGCIHDCAYISGACGSYDRAYVEGENSGTVVEDTVKAWDADDMKTKAFCAAMNASTSVAQYQSGICFVPDCIDSETNDGYPTFAADRDVVQEQSARTALAASDLSYGATGSASYSASTNPVPSVEVSYRGTALVQGADFYALPDEAALGADGKCRSVYDDGSDYIKSGETFNARIVGIGDYVSDASGVGAAPYTIGKGDFSTCSVTIVPTTFNYLAQYPDKEKDVTIIDAAGGTVSSDQWSMAADPGTCINFKRTAASQSHDDNSHIGYEIEFTANADSNYTGTAYGYFVIEKAHIMVNSQAYPTSFRWNGEDIWYWYAPDKGSSDIFGYVYSKDSKGNISTRVQAIYCGEEIKPTVIGMHMEDGNGVSHDLVEGEDYRVVYGDPGRDDLISSDVSTNTNVAKADGEVGTRPCVTVRYVPGDTKNFKNYQSIFFDIVKADVSKKSQVKVSMPSKLTKAQVKKIKKGKGCSKVKLKGYTGKTLAKANYTLKAGKIKGGKVKLTVKGKKNLKGTYTKTVKVE